MDILREKERWLSITTEEQGNIKKFCNPKWPQLKSALSFWVNNALMSNQNIDGHILKMKAQFFANNLHIDDFNQSNASAPSAESLENDRIILQQLLRPYRPEDIWNANETDLFWKMEPSQTLARSKVAEHKK
ncbi:13138_t:CDS:2 [Funneliformis mosseae]|uniref:13138_t:CDS:1 n=1 Tax=Funneliformis mosseae TaxID=27381 RepID=A0A9N9EB45_FUNMO|nr:13138_t:CDS:2 [Funneliformis mosseae]